jgi:hypothetical protein
MIPKVEDGNNFGVSIQEVNFKKVTDIRYFDLFYLLGFIS